MNKETVLGEWIAYFENPRFCPVSACRDSLEEMKALSKLLGNAIRIAHVDCSLTIEVCKILQVKTSLTPKVIYFTNQNQAYLYQGPIKAKVLRDTFMSKDHGYKTH